ncbi:MAG: cell division protein FtsQ/DivIB [Anaerorhabdus sp.]
MVEHKKTQQGESEINVSAENDAVEQVFEKRRKIKQKFDFLKNKPLLFIVACSAGFLIIMILTFLAPMSKVKVISIQGNNYLTQEYVEELSGITKQSVVYFLMPSQIERRIEKSELIANVNVTILKDNIVKIEIIEEEPIAYRYEETPEILLKNGELIPMTEDLLLLIARIPYLTGFNSDEQLMDLAKAFEDVERQSIEQISEISQYSLSYDENAIQLLMMDGNYFFASYFSMPVLNAYAEISSSLVGDGLCLFADDGLEVAYTSICPWDAIDEEKEYWIDDLGNVMVDQYGDPIEKEYYHDSEGNDILDDSGNKVAVPIGEDPNDLSWMTVEEETE